MWPAATLSGSASTSSTNPFSAAHLLRPRSRSSSIRPTPIATSTRPAPTAAASPRRCRFTMLRLPRSAILRPAGFRHHVHVHSRRRRQLFAERATAGLLRRGLLAHLPALHASTTACVTRPPSGSSRARAEPSLRTARTSRCRRCRFPSCPLCRTITASRSRRAGTRLVSARQREDRITRRIRLVLRRSRAERMGDRVSGSQ